MPLASIVGLVRRITTACGGNCNLAHVDAALALLLPEQRPFDGKDLFHRESRQKRAEGIDDSPHLAKMVSTTGRIAFR
jgi:hypothetical protein